MILPPPEKKYDRIAFFGPMASGKTFCARYLIDKYGYQRMSFAAKLKEVAADLLGVTGKDNEGRRALQMLGQSIREIKADAWIDYALKTAPKGKLVVDDLRYQNEAQALRDEGFIIIRTWVPEEIREGRITLLYPNMESTAHQHSSETDMFNIKPDFYVDSWDDMVVSQLDYILSGAYDAEN